MPFGNYFAIIVIVLAAVGQETSLAVAGSAEEQYEYLRAAFDREGFQDKLTTGSISDDMAVKLRFVKSEEGVVVPENFFYEDEGTRRARRNVDQTQRDSIVRALNDIRRTVNSSDIQYMYWNSPDEPMLNTWTANCDYSAKVYVTATARILKIVSANPPDYVAQLHDSFGYPDLQRLLSSVYITKVSANGNFCPKLVTNSTTTFNNSYLGVISLTYVTGFKVNTTQFTVGPPCTTCLSGVYWCDDKLCRADCTPAIPTCYCRPACLNCAGYNETSCKCKCLSGWGGSRCEYNTTMTPTVPNCTTIGPSTYPTTESYTSTITVPITPQYYYYASNATSLQTATTTDANASTTTYLNESTTTENATIGTTYTYPIEGLNATTTSFFNENMTTVQSMNETANDTTSSPIESFNETTTSFLNENMTTVQSNNETANETTPSLPIGSLNETTTSFFDENMTTTVQATNETLNGTSPVLPMNETTSAPVNATEQSSFTTASSINNILNTSTTSAPVRPTIVNNPYDFVNYTQRLLDIENLLLRLLLMFQYYLTTTTTTTVTPAASTSSFSSNDSTGTTPFPANNFSSVAPATAVQANNSAVNTSDSAIYTSSILTPSTSQTQPNGAGTSTMTASSGETTKPPNTIPTDLWNYLNSLDDLKRLLLQILLNLEMRLSQTTTTPPSQNSQTSTAQYQSNLWNSSTAAADSSSSPFSNNTPTASTNPLFPSSNVSGTPANVSNVSVTPAPGGSSSNGADTFPGTSSPPFTLFDPYNPLLMSLLEILRRLEIFLQTSTTSTQNTGSTMPGTASQGNSSANPLPSLAPPPSDNNNNNNNNTSDTSTAPRNETSYSTPSTGNNNNSANSSMTISTLVSNNLTTASNSANSSSSDGRSFTPPFFGSNGSGVPTATTTTTSGSNNDLYHNQIEQLLANILKVLDDILRKTTPDINRPTLFPNSSNVSNTATTTTPTPAPNVAGNDSSIDSNASTTAVYRGNASNASNFTSYPGATGPTPLHPDPDGSAATTVAAPNHPIREFIVRIWDYRTSAAAQPRSNPKNLMSIFLLMGTIFLLF